MDVLEIIKVFQNNIPSIFLIPIWGDLMFCFAEIAYNWNFNTNLH